MELYSGKQRKMRKAVISLSILSLYVLAGCTQPSEQQTLTTTSTSATTADATASTTATAVAARPALQVDGLEITYEDKWVYVNIPADYTDENIGEYFRETEWIVYVPDKNGIFHVENGALYSKDMTRLYAVPSWCEDEETKELPSPQKAFTVPETVTWIAPNAFHMITSERPLINLYLHEGITEENRKELVLWGGTFVMRK